MKVSPTSTASCFISSASEVKKPLRNKIPLKIFPNPASENLLISEIHLNEVGQRASIFNYLGQKIVEFQIESIEQKIDISYLNSGVYFLILSGSISKFVVK